MAIRPFADRFFPAWFFSAGMVEQIFNFWQNNLTLVSILWQNNYRQNNLLLV